MTRSTQLALSLIASAAVTGTAFAAAPVAEGGRKFDTVLSGANECNSAGTCNLGDPDGTGTATLFRVADDDQRFVEISVRELTGAATAGPLRREAPL